MKNKKMGDGEEIQKTIKEASEKFSKNVESLGTRLGLKRMFGKPSGQSSGMWLLSVAPILAMFAIIALCILFMVIIAPMTSSLTVTSNAFQNRSRNTQVQTANMNMRNQYMDDAYNRSNAHTERFAGKKIDESALRGYSN